MHLHFSGELENNPTIIWKTTYYLIFHISKLCPNMNENSMLNVICDMHPDVLGLHFILHPTPIGLCKLIVK